MLPLTSAPDNICIVRLSALGDVTHAVPVVRAIQQHWPQTRITWICATLEHKLLSALDGINFIVVDKKSGWGSYYRLWRQLAGQRFDIMLQMQTSARANFTGAAPSSSRTATASTWEFFKLSSDEIFLMCEISIIKHLLSCKYWKNQDLQPFNQSTNYRYLKL